MVHEAARAKKENAKIFENKKMLKARVSKLFAGMIERQKCPSHVKHQRDY